MQKKFIPPGVQFWGCTFFETKILWDSDFFYTNFLDLFIALL